MLLKIIKTLKAGRNKMLLPMNHIHHLAEDLKILSLGRKPQLVFLEERDDDLPKMFLIRYFESIAILMITSIVLLKVHISALEIFLQRVENRLVASDKLDVEARLHDYATLHRADKRRVAYVYRKTSFSIG
jgi:hypothetical protein